MNREDFWEIVERSRAEVGDTRDAASAAAVARHVVARLTALGPSTAVEFQHFYEALNEESYRWDLWAAAYLMRSGCSDDGFDYFRGWLVAQGRVVWEQAVADPDSLAAVGVDPDDDMVDCEAMVAAAGDAHATSTGDREAFWAALEQTEGDDEPAAPADPAGEDFDFDDDEQMRARLPRLAAVYRPVQ
ncbi:DUF4240 domain-containing protein [Micromonospora humi]|uniref:DUF4240 domain-containing protein n=1 Tax=Micromonospora humi TaxID=745366 RepID=A0A1C5J312_9ACTN|nr:DUF4240 domain-containing protein [Micromonospora humi]SCG64641.1 Protein of unknown function [Micromonospora humi]